MLPSELLAEATPTIMTPVIQYGFAGMCSVLLFMLFWMVKKLFERDDRNIQVMRELTKVISILDVRTQGLNESLQNLTELVARCSKRGN